MNSRGSEGSVRYRVAVLLCVLVSVFAVVNERAVPLGTGVFTMVLIPAGFVLSYARRDERNVWLKVLLAIGLFAAFGDFLRGVRFAQSVDDARVPLAALFMWVQVLHSYDLPRRRDLNFSFASSVALMALAGTLSISSGFAILVLAYLIAAAVTLVLGHESELREMAGPGATEAEPPPGGPRRARAPDLRPAARAAWRPLTAAAAAGLGLTLVAFVALPRLPGAQVTALPFSLAQNSPIAGFTGGVVNPGLPASQGRTGSFAPEAYFGYGEFLSLRVRGRLSDDLMMRVRAPAPSLYRGQVYDTYDGTMWTSSDTSTVTRSPLGDRSIHIDPPEGAWTADRELVQTFFVERELPNLLFHALHAREVFISSASVHVDRFGSIRAPYTLEEDTIYSVISVVADHTPDDLRAIPPEMEFRSGVDRYLAVPPTLSPRFHELARSITDPHPRQVDKVLAVERWLHENTAYRLDVPHDPPNVDPVEHFLFERKEAFCEQIASSMALLLRAAGIPTRLVAGFGPGERNALTGYWEVKNADAHAWVEVLYPGAGWVEYDPTFGVPESPSAGDRFGLRPLGSLLGKLVPPVVREAGLAVLRGIGSGLGAAARVAEAAPAVPIAILAMLIPAGMLVGRLRRRARRPNDPAGRVLFSWLEVESALRRRGITRAPSQTPGELAAQAPSTNPNLPAADLQRLAAIFAATRYGRLPATQAQAEQAEELAARISDAAKAPARVFATR